MCFLNYLNEVFNATVIIPLPEDSSSVSIKLLCLTIIDISYVLLVFSAFKTLMISSNNVSFSRIVLSVTESVSEAKMNSNLSSVSENEFSTDDSGKFFKYAKYASLKYVNTQYL